MKKVIRLTESDLMRIVKRVIEEQMDNTPDPEKHFTMAEQELPKYGFYLNKGMEKTMGVVSLEKPKGCPDNKDSVCVTYVSPAGSYSNQAGYVVSLQAQKNGKYLIDKKWGKNENFKMSDVVNLAKKYNNLIFNS